MFGTSSSKNLPAYPGVLLDKFWSLPSESLLNQVPYTYIAIDPSGGGKSSNTAFMSGYHDSEGNLIILSAADVKSKRPKDYLDVLDQHLEKIVAIDEFKFTKFVFILENNLGMEAINIADYIEKLPYHSVSIEEKSGKMGKYK
jgi:hypothetical protein